MTAEIRTLNYLDDRPIYEIERITVDAWKRGGPEEEKRVRDLEAQKKIDLRAASVADSMQKNADGMKRRKLIIKKMFEELRDEKRDMLT
jgi:hypothetical protein